MRMKGVFRRARRLSIFTIWLSLYRRFYGAGRPARHLKIDDEECLIETAHKDKPRFDLDLMIKLIFLLLGLIALVSSIAYIVYKPPLPLINYLQWKYPDVRFHFPLTSSLKVVAITLDDAPSPESARLLDLLYEYRAKATFFVIGNQISDHPHIIQRIHDEGHEIGIHGWADEPSYKLPLTELIRQIKKIEKMLPLNTVKDKWFRPGSGWFTKSMVEELRSMNYKISLGSIYPHDAQIRYPKINAAHVLSMMRPGGVIIMHDRRPYSYEQLELVLQGLVARNWRAQTLSSVQRLMENSTEVIL